MCESEILGNFFDARDRSRLSPYRATSRLHPLESIVFDRSLDKSHQVTSGRPVARSLARSSSATCREPERVAAFDFFENFRRDVASDGPRNRPIAQASRIFQSERRASRRVATAPPRLVSFEAKLAEGSACTACGGRWRTFPSEHRGASCASSSTGSLFAVNSRS